MKSSALPHPAPFGYGSCDANNAVACQCTTALCGAGLLNPLGAVQEAFKPAAVITNTGTPGLGASLALDGRASAAVGTPTIASYAWRQISGPALSLPHAGASVTQVVLPNAAGTFIFKLRVTDTLGQVGEAQLYINTEPPAAAIGSATSGGGGGADSGLWLALLVLLGLGFLSRFDQKNSRWPPALLRKLL
jgi:hypothetical protein